MRGCALIELRVHEAHADDPIRVWLEPGDTEAMGPWRLVAPVSSHPTVVVAVALFGEAEGRAVLEIAPGLGTGLQVEVPTQQPPFVPRLLRLPEPFVFPRGQRVHARVGPVV